MHEAFSIRIIINVQLYLLNTYDISCQRKYFTEKKHLCILVNRLSLHGEILYLYKLPMIICTNKILHIESVYSYIIYCIHFKINILFKNKCLLLSLRKTVPLIKFVHVLLNLYFLRL